MHTEQAVINVRVSALLEDLPKERSQLLPALWRVFEEYWCLEPEMIEAISNAMGVPYAEVYGVASFYALFDNPEGCRPIYVCTDVMCALRGSEDLLKSGQIGAKGTPVSIKGAPCLGYCDEAPAMFDGKVTKTQVTQDALAQLIRGEKHA